MAGMSPCDHRALLLLLKALSSERQTHRHSNLRQGVLQVHGEYGEGSNGSTS